MRAIDITGVKFGRLTAIKKIQGVFWLFKCSCGVEKIASNKDVKSGRTQSCGCYRKERRTSHGLSTSSIYGLWNSMVNRCYNPRSKAFNNYGRRGIRVCDRWKVFENFLTDMGHKPKGHSLERINNSGDYEPENCEWVSIGVQNRNKRNSINIRIRGETMNLKDWADSTGIHYDTLYSRYVAGKRGEELIRKVASNAR